MLKLAICDWNRTLYPDYFEEGYFGGICVWSLLRAIWNAEIERIVTMFCLGLRCCALFLKAMVHRDGALEYITQITETINRGIIAGLPADSVDRFTEWYARWAARRLDRRLLGPLWAARRRYGVRLAVISSGSRVGIQRTLERAGCPFDVVVGNEFRFDGDVVASLELSVMANKAEILGELLAREGITRDEVLYVGDSRPDEGCFAEVGYPVVSYLAREKDKLRFGRRHGAFVPRNGEEFARHLQRACTGGRS